MAKRGLIALVVLALLAGAWFAYRQINPELAIEFSQTEVEAKLGKHFPVEKCLPLNIACFVLKTPKIALASGADRADVSTTFGLKLGSTEYPGSADFSSKIRFEAKTGEFFLDDVELKNFNVNGQLGDLEQIVNTQGKFVVNKLMAGVPIYTLGSDSREQQIAKSVVKDVKIANGKLRVVLLSANKS